MARYITLRMENIASHTGTYYDAMWDENQPIPFASIKNPETLDAVIVHIIGTENCFIYEKLKPNEKPKKPVITHRSIPGPVPVEPQKQLPGQTTFDF